MAATAIPTAPAGTTTPPPASVGPRRWRWTREQYHKLGELGLFDGKRVQLIFGEIVEMSPINWPHALCVGLVAEALRNTLGEVGWVSTHGPHPTADSEPEPDVRVVPGSIRDYTDHPTVALVVVEVSDSTLFFDTTTKAELYATAGVTDYWVVDINARQLHVFRDPEPLPAGLGATAYRTRRVLTDADTVCPLAAPAASIRVAELLP